MPERVRFGMSLDMENATLRGYGCYNIWVHMLSHH